MLAETSWAQFWKDLVEMTPNKEVVMNIVEHMEDVILIFRLFKIFYFLKVPGSASYLYWEVAQVF